MRMVGSFQRYEIKVKKNFSVRREKPKWNTISSLPHKDSFLLIFVKFGEFNFFSGRNFPITDRFFNQTVLNFLIILIIVIYPLYTHNQNICNLSAIPKSHIFSTLGIFFYPKFSGDFYLGMWWLIFIREERKQKRNEYNKRILYIG